MAKLEKHKRNLIQQWLEAEEGVIPAHPRGFEALETNGKIRKPPVPGKLHPPLPDQPAPKPEPALIREPARSPKVEEKHSQASSREHLLKQERLPQLRAPFSRSRVSAPGGKRRPAVGASRAAARRTRGRRAPQRPR